MAEIFSQSLDKIHEPLSAHYPAWSQLPIKSVSVESLVTAIKVYGTFYWEGVLCGPIRLIMMIVLSKLQKGFEFMSNFEKEN